MRRWFVGSCVVALSAAVLLFVAAWYHAGRLAAPAHSPVGEPPSWFVGENVELPSRSGATIKGWFMPIADAQAGVVLLHHIRGNRRNMLDRARFLVEAGCAVLLVDLQAHGESLGEWISFGHLESEDARAAVEFLRSEVNTGPIVVLGSSLGGAAAVLAQPPIRADGFILESVFPTIEKAIENRLRMRMGTFGAVFTPVLLWQIMPRLGVAPEALRPVQAAKAITAEVFVISGDADQRTTAMDTLVLFQSFQSKKQLWLIPGARHQDLHRYAGQKYERRVLAFIRGLSNSMSKQAGWQENLGP